MTQGVDRSLQNAKHVAKTAAKHKLLYEMSRLPLVEQNKEGAKNTGGGGEEGGDTDSDSETYDGDGNRRKPVRPTGPKKPAWRPSPRG